MDECLGEQCDTASADDLIWARVMITNPGEVYSTVAGCQDIKWPSQEWEARGSLHTWSAYYPKKSQQGEIVHCWRAGDPIAEQRSWNADTICLFKPDRAVWEGQIEKQPFVPIGCSGLHFVLEMPPK
eukprot:m.27221 g.27221  ORF g.27221 m.27221 type:complete len:127 (-) comp8497_c0_seq1:114-494(-)